MSRIRIRCRNYSVGQVLPFIEEKYAQIHGKPKLNLLAEGIIEREILKHQVKGASDIKKAEELVKKAGYDNIGEYIEEYMRNDISGSLRLCKNCKEYPICKEKPVSPFDSCEKFNACK